MPQTRRASRRKSAVAAAAAAAPPPPAATAAVDQSAPTADDSSPPAIANGSVRAKMRAHALRHGRSRSLTREAHSASPPLISSRQQSQDDEDDDPARAAWGLGGRNRAISNVDDAPVGVLSRTLCCAGGRGSLSWLGLAIVTSALALLSLAIHLLLDLLGEQLEVWSSVLAEAGEGISVVRFLAGVATLLVLVAVPITHGVVGVRRHGYLSYTFWQPFVGGLRFVLLQVLAWTIWTITVLAGAYAAWVGTKKVRLSPHACRVASTHSTAFVSRCAVAMVVMCSYALSYFALLVCCFVWSCS